MTDTTGLRRAIADAIRQEARTSVPRQSTLRPVRKVGVFLPFAVEPEPTEEDRARWARRSAERDREYAALLASHAPRVAAAEGVIRELLELHAPVTNGHNELPPWNHATCDGCDMDGHDAEAPQWPCRTYDVLASWSG